jgi:phosphatidylinositol-3,4,5-trisphosphate 3-phosphatase/dual-specificity protein phosphatase PTEN
MKEPSGAKFQVVKVANILLDQASKMKSSTHRQSTDSDANPPPNSNKPSSPDIANNGPIWISLARYDDTFVETLEQWEVHTRHPSTPGRRREGSEHFDRGKGEGEEEIGKMFDNSGRWDKTKMVRRFVTFGSGEKQAPIEDTQVCTTVRCTIRDSHCWQAGGKGVPI